MISIKMKHYYCIVVLFLIAYCTVFANSNLLDLDVMEVRNIVTAREMVTEHNWLIPTMNGEIRIAKPPLPTWLTALPLVFGKSDDNLGALRIPSGIASCVLMLFVYFFVAELSDDLTVPFICAAVLISSEFFIVMSKRASWDIFCHTFMLGAIWLFFRGWKKRENSLYIYLFAGILMALSFLSKGPVSFHSMLLPFLLSYLYIFGKETFLQQWKGNLFAVFICLVISSAWPLYLYIFVPDAFVHVEATELRTWVDVIKKPVWYYISFPIHAGIWVCLVISAILYRLFRNKSCSFSCSKNYNFLLLWIFWTVLLLTIVPKKSTHYLFPVIVPLSILGGFCVKYLIEIFSEKRDTIADKLIITIHGVIVFTVAIACSAFFIYDFIQTKQALFFQKSVAIVIFSFIGFLSLYFLKKRKIIGLMSCTVVLVCVVCLVIPQVVAQRVHHRSFMILKESRAEIEGKNIAIYSSYEMDIKEIWAVGQRVKKIDPAELVSLPKPLALYTQDPPEKVLQNSPVSIKSVNYYVDKRSSKTDKIWYLSILDKAVAVSQ
jgi:4-amino-4-deoxy-L-arabinose transferase-like glycosyltransferase